MADLPEAVEAVKGPVKKKSSFRSLFSIFKSSKPSNSKPSPNGYSKKDNRLAGTTMSFSAPTLHGRLEQRPPAAQDPTALTVSLPAPSSNTPPPSSSSSTSSLEFASDASTAATTPSTSVPSVLMKSSDAPSASSVDDLGESGGSESAGRGSQSTKNPVRAISSDNFRKQPSPLSTVTMPEPSPYILPSPPPSPVLHERRNSFQPKRRNSLGRLLARGYQSNPDLSRPCGDEDNILRTPKLPTSAPSSRPASSGGSPPKAKSQRKKEKGRADLEKPTSYSQQEKIEHQSILGADPAGYGFYLYPRTSVPELSPKNSKVDYYGGAYSTGVNGSGGRGSCSGNDGGPRRGSREPKGRSFRGNVATQVIVEEEAHEGHDDPSTSRPQRRHSEASGLWRQPRLDAAPVPPLPVPASNSTLQSLPSIGSRLEEGNAAIPTLTRRQSLHNSWEHSNAQMQRHQGPLPSLQLPLEKRGDGRTIDNEEMALQGLHRDAMRFVNKSHNDDSGEFSSSQQITNKLGVVMQTPILRVEMVDV